MKFLTKLVICLLVLAMPTMMLFGCSNEPEATDIPFTVSAAENHMSSTTGHKLLRIVRSVDELNSVASTRYHQYWTSDGGPFNVYYLAELTQQYDANYFKENALVLYLFGAGNAGGVFDIKQMERKGKELTMSFEFVQGAATAISYWTIVVEVSKSDVQGVTTLKTNHLPFTGETFTDDLIIIVLTEQVSKENWNREYTPADFPEFNFSLIENLLSPFPWQTGHKRILFLHLAEPSHTNVLLAVELIRQRPDVFSAEVNSIMYGA